MASNVCSDASGREAGDRAIKPHRNTWVMGPRVTYELSSRKRWQGHGAVLKGPANSGDKVLWWFARKGIFFVI